MNLNNYGSLLFRALHHSDLKAVQRLIIDEGVSPNHQFPDGSFPLHIAAEKHNATTVKFLLSMNASVDYKNHHGETSLMITVNNYSSVSNACNVIHIVSAMVNKGCRVNLCDSNQRTALHLACSKGIPSVVKILINAGARVNCKDKWGRSPLHMVLLNISHNAKDPIKNYFHVVKVLLANNCDINKKGHNLQATPIFLVVSIGDHCIELAKMLIDAGSNLNKPSRRALTPIIVAVKKNYYNLVKLLVTYNCDVNVQYNKPLYSCLYTASANGCLPIAKILVANGCSLGNNHWWLSDENTNPVKKLKDHNPVFYRWIEKICQGPLTLQEMCRINIRQSFGRNISTNVQEMEYPGKLKGYILLEDVFAETDAMNKESVT